jgi:uncharacterized glyoxalase superfamily protein PhnB
MAELMPYLCVEDARRAVDWYCNVLGAEVSFEPIVMDDNKIGHVELSIEGARLMMSDPYPDRNAQAPDPGRGNAVSLHLTVTDVDSLAARIADSGISLDRGPESTEHGRVAVFRDPFHHRWFLNQPS